MSDFNDEMTVRSAFIRKIALKALDTLGEVHISMGGRTYVYEVPEPFYWDAFKDAASKGKYYNAILKRRFDYVRKY